MAEIYLNQRWIKLTPAFNIELCQKLSVNVLEFNGAEDAVFQECDLSPGGFMEYLHDHGSFAALPFERMVETFFEYYPHLQRKRTLSIQ